MSHVHHQSLEDYDEDAVLQDGCPTCEARAREPYRAILNLDENNAAQLWRVMLSHEWGGGDGELRPASDCDRELVSALYQIAVFIQRFTDIDPFTPGGLTELGRVMKMRAER